MAEQSTTSLESLLAGAFRYKQLHQVAYRYVHRTLANEVAISKRQVAARMLERFPDCAVESIDRAVEDVFRSF